MTPAEVAGRAFGGNVSPDAVGESAVVAAQLRYIKPVLGSSLYTALEKGAHAPLVEEWIKPALALFVKYMVLPSVAFRTGELGVVKFAGDYFHAADANDVASLRRIARSEAETALSAAVAHIEASAADYPEYDSRESVANRLCVIGGIVL